MSMLSCSLSLPFFSSSAWFYAYLYNTVSITMNWYHRFLPFSWAPISKSVLQYLHYDSFFEPENQHIPYKSHIFSIQILFGFIFEHYSYFAFFPPYDLISAQICNITSPDISFLLVPTFQEIFIFEFSLNFSNFIYRHRYISVTKLIPIPTAFLYILHELGVIWPRWWHKSFLTLLCFTRITTNKPF